MKKKFTVSGVAILFFGVLIGSSGCGQSVEAEPKKLSALSAFGMLKEFYVGDEFSTGDLTVLARYDDGTTAALKTGEYAVDASLCDMYFAGSYPVMVSAIGGNVSCSYTIDVIERQFDGEYLEARATKTLYSLGEGFAAEGVEVILHGECAEQVRTLSPEEYTLDSSAFDSAHEGQYVVKAKMKETGLSAHFSVKVRKDYMPSFKILAIGNSFSDDATEYLYDIAKAYGSKDVIVANMYIGGCTLNQHRTYAQTNQPVYEYRKNTTGNMITRGSFRLLDALREEDWDIITLQQASQDSGRSATYNEDLAYLINFIKEYRTNPDCRIAWHMTWAYQQNTTHWAFPNYESDQRVMYESIVHAVEQKILPGGEFDYILPVGTAIQNARTSTIGDTLTRDGYHLTLDTGRFIAALTWYLEITGKDISDLPSALSIPSGTAGVIEIVKDAISSALKHPFSVTQSAYPAEKTPDKGYRQIQLQFLQGFWRAPQETLQDSKMFAATAERFTREQLPVGTVLLLADGWRLRPEAWGEEGYFARPANMLEHYIVVDENWWDGFSYRAFNLSKLTGENVTAEEASAALKVYLPEEIVYK